MFEKTAFEKCSCYQATCSTQSYWHAYQILSKKAELYAEVGILLISAQENLWCKIGIGIKLKFQSSHPLLHAGI